MPVSVYWGQNDWFSAEVDYTRMLDEVGAVIHGNLSLITHFDSHEHFHKLVVPVVNDLRCP